MLKSTRKIATFMKFKQIMTIRNFELLFKDDDDSPLIYFYSFKYVNLKKHIQIWL